MSAVANANPETAANRMAMTLAPHQYAGNTTPDSLFPQIKAWLGLFNASSGPGRETRRFLLRKSQTRLPAGPALRRREAPARAARPASANRGPQLRRRARRRRGRGAQ